MNRRTLRATGIVLTGMLLAGDPVSMIYAAPVAGVSVGYHSRSSGSRNGSSSPSAGVSLAVADCLSQAMRKWRRKQQRSRNR